MKGKTWVDIGITVIKSIAATIFFGFLIFSIYYIVSDRAPLFSSEEPVSVIKYWTYYDQIDGAKNITSPYSINRENRDVFKFEAILPTDIPKDSVIAFLNLSSIEVSIDDRIIYSWDKTTVPLWGGAPKNNYFFIDLPTEYSGHRITITRFGAQNSKLLDAYVGNKYAVIRYLENLNGIPNFILSIFLLIFSLLVFVASLVLITVFKKKVHLAQISLGIFMMSCWLFFDSFEFQFVFRTRFIDGFLAYICTITMVFPFFYYLDDLQKRRYHKTYFGIEVIEILNTLVFFILQVTGVQPFTHSLLYIDLIILVGIIVAFVITLIDIFKYKHKSYRIFGLGFLVFLFFGAIEVIAINFITERVQGLYILLGLFVLLAFSIVQEAHDIILIQHERDLATANASARTRFLASMSHEIRTPINSILGMNEIIIKEADDPQIKSYANIVNDSGQLLLSLINDILDFSKIDSGKHEIVYAPYNPHKIITSICSIMKERAENKNLLVRYDISSSIPPLLYGDAKSISEILLNLLSNAIKYTNEGTISLTVDCINKDNTNYVFHFTISDTGIGIKSEDYDKIFDPFSRTDLKKNQTVQGTGLGLAITKQLVEEMDGVLSLHSEYGVGSTFMVTLPQRIPTTEEIENSDLMIEEPFIIEEDINNIDENYTAPNASILVVDDNNTNLIVVKAFLKNSGINIDIADGGRKSFEMCCAKKYDVILMDHMMPGCDGIEAMHLIKERPESQNQNTPIIILTANAIKGSDKHYIEEGFDNYLSKPVDSALLKKMVRKYLPNEKVN